jgi:hypothetical protein
MRLHRVVVNMWISHTRMRGCVECWLPNGAPSVAQSMAGGVKFTHRRLRDGGFYIFLG